MFKQEQNLLRSEAQDLKRCQLQYFILSITACGAIFGIAKAFDNNVGFIMLAPLVILLPCWITFFDKATTITRLIGYMRILEDVLGKKQGVNAKYIGYENALASFRREEENKPYEGTITFAEIMKLFILRTRNRYWIINWYTYFGLSSTCCALSIYWSNSHPENSEGLYYFIGICIFLVITTTCYSFYMIIHLTYGKYSYNHVTEFWISFMPNYKDESNEKIIK